MTWLHQLLLNYSTLQMIFSSILALSFHGHMDILPSKQLPFNMSQLCNPETLLKSGNLFKATSVMHFLHNSMEVNLKLQSTDKATTSIHFVNSLPRSNPSIANMFNNLQSIPITRQKSCSRRNSKI